MYYRILLWVIIGCLCSCRPEANKTAQEWRLVYKNDRHGQTLEGDKNALLEAVRQGGPIRVGWASRRQSDTTKSVEHLVDAEFMTIANGKEVFAQITPFLAQRPDLTSDTLSMTLLPSHSYWILGTNGTISSVGHDYIKDTVITRAPSSFRHPIGWYAQVPSE
ncbi:hypothetical protein ABV409_15210 [Flagellimonas sp. DF-77]|uniref:hypothetical protein n=1 Tax=Flagellimonas algarum TaxID=3230298 RepID=UPI003396F84A